MLSLAPAYYQVFLAQEAVWCGIGRGLGVCTGSCAHLDAVYDEEGVCDWLCFFGVEHRYVSIIRLESSTRLARELIGTSNRRHHLSEHVSKTPDFSCIRLGSTRHCVC